MAEIVDITSKQTTEVSPAEVKQGLTAVEPATLLNTGKKRTSFISTTSLLFLGLLAFLLWSALFELDETVRASGNVIPSARTQIIQAVDGGVLSALLVQEGDKVVMGERLAVLEKTRVNASYEESRAQVASLNAALIRAKAEAAREAPIFGQEFADYPDYVLMQQSLYQQKVQKLRDEMSILNANLTLAKEEQVIYERLYADGDASRIELMQVRQRVIELQGNVSGLNNQYLQEVRQEIAQLSTELASNRFQLQERKNRLIHTDIIAPVAGVVKYMRLNTVGGVLRPGDELMQLSPTDGDLIIEAKVNPVDIGQLKEGLPVSIKLDAFDYSIYGGLEGVLTYISADTLNEKSEGEQSASYYRVQVKLDKGAQANNPKLSKVVIKQGMTASIDIKTNRRTVLQYLAKPILRAFSGALNER
jgi:adhesin transport system membrane fusion protein